MQSPISSKLVDAVVVSNGFHRFHLSVAAEELSARGVLAELFTGAYPTGRARDALARAGVLSRKLRRFLDRRAAVPDEAVTAFFLAEALEQFSRLLPRAHALRLSRWIELASYRAYARRASSALERVSPSATIYHYRSGFGGDSAAWARRRGMISLCDHSIVHPNTLDYLLHHGGRLPSGRAPHQAKGLWREMLLDTEAADAVLVNSDFVKDTFLREGWDPDRIHVIYLGVDDKFLEALPADRPPPDEGPLRLLFAGSFEQRKGAHILCQALGTFDDVDWELTIAGPIAPDMRKVCGDLLEDPRVDCIGTISRSDLARRMARADVFVFPSLAEGSARVVFEAMAAGCYVITTANSGTVVQDGVHGALIEPGSPTELLASIRTADADRDRLRQVGHFNAEFVRTHYRQRHYGDRLEDLYLTLLDSAPA